MRKTFIFFTIMFCVQLIASMSHSETTKEIKVIRELYKETNDLIKKNKVEYKFFCTDLNGYENNIWNEVKEKEYLDCSMSSEVALMGSEIIKAIFTIESPSGDWVNISEYYFYKGGTVAFIFESHKTFQGYNFDKDEELPSGPYVIEIRRYFNGKSKEIRILKKAFIESSKKEIPVKYVRHVGLPLYKNISMLPFINHLHGK